MKTRQVWWQCDGCPAAIHAAPGETPPGWVTDAEGRDWCPECAFRAEDDARIEADRNAAQEVPE